MTKEKWGRERNWKLTLAPNLKLMRVKYRAWIIRIQDKVIDVSTYSTAVFACVGWAVMRRLVLCMGFNCPNIVSLL